MQTDPLTSFSQSYSNVVMDHVLTTK